MDVTAEESLAFRLKAIRETGGGQEQVDYAIAQNVLHEELGYFTSKSRSYSIDEETRDRLIVHGRQDAAHALIAATTAGREIRKVQLLLLVLTLAMVVLAAAQVWLVLR